MLVSIIEHPYSPGAIYHSIKKLNLKKMIETNHENMIIINQTGREQVTEVLLHAPIPSNFVNLFYLAASLDLVNDNSMAGIVKKRLQLSMIDFNQNNSTINSPNFEKKSKALVFFRKKISESLLQIVHNIGE